MEPLLAALRSASIAKEAQDWAREGAAEYQIWPSAKWNGPSTDGLLSDFGWTTTSLGTAVDGSGAGNFLSAGTPGTLPGQPMSAASALLLSPAIFGSFLQGKAAAWRMGSTQLPVKLVMEMYASFPTASANENTTGLGFSQGTSITQTNQIAFVSSNGVNFVFAGNGVTGSVVGPAVDNLVHLFRFELDRVAGIVRPYVDDVQFGTMGLVTGKFPMSFAVSVKAGPTNAVTLNGGRIYYA